MKTNLRICQFFSAVLITLAMSAQSAEAETIFDPAADFNSASNPNGVWSYGWSQTLTSSFHLFPNSSPNEWFDATNDFGDSPNISKHSGPAFDNGNIDAPAGTYLAFTFGGLDGHDYSHLIFTAPTSAEYAISLTLLAIQRDISADVQILNNGASLLSDVFLVDQQKASYSGSLFLHAGDTIDVADGPNGIPFLHPGSVAIFGTITQDPSAVPQPSSLVMLAGAGVVAGIGVAARRSCRTNLSTKRTLP